MDRTGCLRQFYRQRRSRYPTNWLNSPIAPSISPRLGSCISCIAFSWLKYVCSVGFSPRLITTLVFTCVWGLLHCSRLIGDGTGRRIRHPRGEECKAPTSSGVWYPVEAYTGRYRRRRKAGHSDRPSQRSCPICIGQDVGRASPTEMSKATWSATLSTAPG
jgi:hypothetical protein